MKRDLRLDRMPGRWERILGIVAALLGFLLLALLSAALVWLGTREEGFQMVYVISAGLALIALFCLRVFVRAVWGRPERLGRRAHAVASWSVLIVGLAGVAAAFWLGPDRNGLLASGSAVVVMGLVNLAGFRARS